VRWAEHIARIEEMYKKVVLAEKSIEKRLLGRSKHKFKDNIKLEPRETGCAGVEWI
jgi:hypothetical protein